VCDRQGKIHQQNVCIFGSLCSSFFERQGACAIVRIQTDADCVFRFSCVVVVGVVVVVVLI
jgi:hypothetical protein